jgi:hypothetical protein
MSIKFWSSKNGMNNPYTQLLFTLILLLVSSPLASRNIEKLFASLVFVVNLLIIINLLHLRKKKPQDYLLYSSISCSILTNCRFKNIG